MRQLLKFFILALLSINAYADSSSDALTSLLLNMQTMQADFTQRVLDKAAHAIQQAQGHMALQRPGKFRWDVKAPTPQLIIANGNKLWIYDKDLEQVTVRTFKAAAGQTPALLLSDKSLTLSRDFNVKPAKNVSQVASQSFVLIPKDKDNLFESIQLTFMNKQIQEMQLRDHLGHTTVIQFKNIQFGKPLAAALFTFHAPAHTDVIDETKQR